MNELEQNLRVYLPVADDEMTILTSCFHRETLEKGDYFLKAGRVGNKFSFHLDGLIRIFAMHGNKEATQWISYKGNFISDLRGIIFGEPAPFSMQALSHCELYTIDKKDYLSLPDRISRWPLLERAFIARCFNVMEMRVFSLLSMTAEERYAYLQEQNPSLFDTVPLKYLASMMGITPESLSRIRKKKMG